MLDKTSSRFFVAVEGQVITLGRNGAKALVAFDKLNKVHHALDVHYAEPFTYFYNFIDAFLYKFNGVTALNVCLDLNTAILNCEV